MGQPVDVKGEYPHATPLDALGVISAQLLISLDRAAIDPVMKWRPRWYSQLAAQVVAHHTQWQTRVDDWRQRRAKLPVDTHDIVMGKVPQ
jgi:hypothetical protein